VHGLVVPARDEAALADAVVRVRDDGALRRDVAARNRARFEQLFSLGAMLGGHEALYEEVRGAAAAPRAR
jgi:glycosyltransferase involved in cell wall biosynthesis